MGRGGWGALVRDFVAGSNVACCVFIMLTRVHIAY